jgi:hypothetical protein
MASDLSDLDLLVIRIDGIHMDEDLILVCSDRCRRERRQAWELDDAAKAERLLRNLAQRLEREWSGVAGSILEGSDEILTVTRLGLPHGAARISEREAMALGLNGNALDRGRHAGSGQRLPTTADSQAASNVPGRSGTSLLAKPSPLNINLGSDLFSMFNKGGTSPRIVRIMLRLMCHRLR